MNTIAHRYLTAIRARVCHHCSDLLPDQMCGLPDRVCPIEQNLQEVVLMVHYSHEEPIQPYLNELRQMACAACGSGGVTGQCARRQKNECALDRYFLLVVETIEDVQDEIRAESRAAVSG